MRTIITATMLAACLAAGSLFPAAAQNEAPIRPPGTCGPLALTHMRTTLYFGLARKMGSVSESQWRTFLRDHVTPKFPEGFTVWQAGGQWRQSDGRIARERSRILLLVHEDSPAVRARLESLVTDYKRIFEQESVLWETTPVCAMF